MRYCFATNPARMEAVHVPGDPQKCFSFRRGGKAYQETGAGIGRNERS
jgi:hypothetical protein